MRTVPFEFFIPCHCTVLHNAMLCATMLVVSALPVMRSLASINTITKHWVNSRQAPFKLAGNLLLERLKTGWAK
eukprot:646068-Ditylum_brightwellii.AAC.1